MQSQAWRGLFENFCRWKTKTYGVPVVQSHEKKGCMLPVYENYSTIMKILLRKTETKISKLNLIWPCNHSTGFLISEGRRQQIKSKIDNEQKPLSFKTFLKLQIIFSKLLNYFVFQIDKCVKVHVCFITRRNFSPAVWLAVLYKTSEGERSRKSERLRKSKQKDWGKN